MKQYKKPFTQAVNLHTAESLLTGSGIEIKDDWTDTEEYSNRKGGWSSESWTNED